MFKETFGRNQKTGGIETSWHPYRNDYTNIYENEKAVIEAFSSDVPDDELTWDFDLDTFKLKEGYVCCVRVDESIDEIPTKWGISGAASDDYTVQFESEEYYEIADGYIARCDKIEKVRKN